MQAFCLNAHQGVGGIGIHLEAFVAAFADRSHFNKEIVQVLVNPCRGRFAVAAIGRNLIVIRAGIGHVEILACGLVDSGNLGVFATIFAAIHLERLRFAVVVPAEQGAKAFVGPLVFASETRRRQAATTVIVARIKRGRNLVGVASKGVDRIIIRVLDVDCQALDSSIRSHPAKRHVALGHTNLLADRRCGSHGDFVDDGVEGILHLNLTTVPALEVGGLTDHFPSAGRTILIVDLSDTSFGVIGHEIDAIRVAIVIGHIVFKMHDFARSHVAFGEDLLTITEQHHLVDVLQSVTTQRGGGIGPADHARLGMGILSLDFKVGDSGDKSVIDIIGDVVEDGSLTIVEAAVPTRVQCIDGVVVVERTAPAPVEIELAVNLTIATAGKGVTTRFITTGIIQREAFFQTGNQHFFPIVLGVEVAVHARGMVGVAEIVGNRRRNILGISTRRTATIHHIDRHAAMVHQGSDGLVVGVVAGVRHVGPIVSRGTEIHRLHRITFRRIAVLAIALDRPIPVLHHHRHGRCHTASVGMTARAAMSGGTIGIVRIILVPKCGQQRSNVATGAAVVVLETVLGHMHPFRSHFHFRLKIVGLGVGNLTRIETQVVGKAVRHVVRVNALCIGKREDGTSHIVSRNEDKATVEIEHVNGRVAILRHFGVGKRKISNLSGRMALHILHTQLTGIIHVDGRSDELTHKQGQSHHQK